MFFRYLDQNVRISWKWYPLTIDPSGFALLSTYDLSFPKYLLLNHNSVS